MSLNGLDDAKILEAYQTAAAEPGGWFLLKYASRDEVELLGRGNGGIVEIRNSVAQYEDPSPLYGFLRYRRRNVIIKYLPEDCSRLVQARVTVHFTSICDRFSPYDTTFSIAEAKELKDSKLSAACSLHAASGSTSSSTSSLRRRRLMEIAEEEEDEQRASKRQSVVQEDRPEFIDVEQTTEQAPPVTLNADLAASPEESKFANTAEPPDFTGAPRPPSPTKSFVDENPPRLSSQSTRQELYSYSAYSYGTKQKVKLGPRPSLDVSGRPRTAGTFRPVSQLPAGFKFHSKGSKKGRSKEPDDNPEPVNPQDELPEITFAASSMPTSDSIHEPADLDMPRPHTSSGRPASSYSNHTGFAVPTFRGPAQEKMTPEKARLMKAMQLREKKKKLSMLHPDGLPVPTSPPPASDSPTQAEHEHGPMESPVAEKIPDSGNLLGPDVDADDRSISLSKADSAIAMDRASLADQVSELTQTDSHPASPLIPSSEPDNSTKASSISESTDETVAAKTDDQGPALSIDDADADVDTSAAETTPIATYEHKEEDIVDTAVDAPSGMAPHFAEEDGAAERGASPSFDRLEDEHPVPNTTEHGTEPLDSEVVAQPGGRTTIGLPLSKFAKAPELANENVAEAEADVPSPQLLVPKSKFSRQDSNTTLHIESAVVDDVETEEPNAEGVHAVPPYQARHDLDDHKEARRSLALPDNGDADSASLHSRRSRRKGIMDPIITNLELPDAPRSESHLSEDDALMDELQSATVEQAQPMFVSKSPITPVMPGGLSRPGSRHTRSGSPTPQPSRTVSQPAVRPSLLSPSGALLTTSGRSVSSGSAFLHKISQQSPANLAAKNTKLGSSISQRIKALEKLSSGAPAVPPAAPNTAASATFFSVRKTSAREPSRSPSLADRASTFTKANSPPRTSHGYPGQLSPDMANASSARDRAASVASRLSMFEPIGQRGRPESIQVTARIIRDPSQPLSKVVDTKKESAEYSPLDLRQSHLVVDHQKATPAVAAIPLVSPDPEVEPARVSIQERRMSKETRRSQSQDRILEGDAKRRSSLSIVKDFIKERRKSLTSSSLDALASPTPVTPSRSPSRPPSVHQNSAFPRRLSISSRRSSISKEAGTPSALSPTMMTETSGSGDEAKSGGGASSSSGGEKKSKSRAGRFMRRLSSSLGGSRKNISPGISPTLHEDDAAETAAMRDSESRSSNGPSITAYMGDVNVQFPDNLLWKRRSMCLDSHGFLILSSVAATAAPKDKQMAGAGVKRYHLSEFRPPYVPEMEVQELPNSVCLDFVEGSGLQIACEDRSGQRNVLHTLQDAHASHSSFGH